MPSNREPNPILLAAVTLAVLLGLYVGAYYVAVWPISDPFHHQPTVAIYSVKPKMIVSGPLPPGETGWNRFFAPMEWLDRRIRPNVWEPELLVETDSLDGR